MPLWMMLSKCWTLLCLSRLNLSPSPLSVAQSCGWRKAQPVDHMCPPGYTGNMRLLQFQMPLRLPGQLAWEKPSLGDFETVPGWALGMHCPSWHSWWLGLLLIQHWGTQRAILHTLSHFPVFAPTWLDQPACWFPHAFLTLSDHPSSLLPSTSSNNNPIKLTLHLGWLFSAPIAPVLEFLSTYPRQDYRTLLYTVLETYSPPF